MRVILHRRSVLAPVANVHSPGGRRCSGTRGAGVASQVTALKTVRFVRSCDRRLPDGAAISSVPHVRVQNVFSAEAFSLSQNFAALQVAIPISRSLPTFASSPYHRALPDS